MPTRSTGFTYRGPAHVVPIIAILLLAAALRFVDLEPVPPGLNVDEALHAYEAF